jgi:cytochrome P450 family 6
LIFSASFVNISRKLGFRFIPKEPADFFMNAFCQTFDHRQKNNIVRNDFISLLLSLKDSFTTTELAAEAFLFHTGGYETSSTLISFALYELAVSPDIQERLRLEIRTGIEENGGKLTYDLLFGFKYLDMVINESLRKYPPIPDLPRKCIMDYNIPGTNLIIPKGTMIETSVYSFHHDPEYFPDPEKFDPERFNEENVKNIVPYTYFPFGN